METVRAEDTRLDADITCIPPTGKQTLWFSRGTWHIMTYPYRWYIFHWHATLPKAHIIKLVLPRVNWSYNPPLDTACRTDHQFLKGHVVPKLPRYRTIHLVHLMFWMITCPPKSAFWRWFSELPQVGYVNFLEGMLLMWMEYRPPTITSFLVLQDGGNYHLHMLIYYRTKVYYQYIGMKKIQ